MSGLQKLEQRAKKCIELCGEYVEQIPSLVAVACFLPGRAKDLSAPPRIFHTVKGTEQMLSDNVTGLLLPLDIIAVDLPNLNRQRTLLRCCSRLPFVVLFWRPFCEYAECGLFKHKYFYS